MKNLIIIAAGGILSICEKFLNFFKNESKILTTSYSAHLTPF